MSRENVELARIAYEAWNEGDFDALLAILHPEIETLTSGVYLGLDPVYSGHDGFRKFLRDFVGTFESLRTEVEELRDCGECVLALLTFEARGRDGLEVRRQAGNVLTFRDGLAVRIEAYAEWAKALEAVGLRE
jgi:ketosteroid isomerase-like protein